MHIWETWLVKKLIHPLPPHVESRVVPFYPWRCWVVEVVEPLWLDSSVNSSPSTRFPWWYWDWGIHHHRASRPIKGRGTESAGWPHRVRSHPYTRAGVYREPDCSGHWDWREQRRWKSRGKGTQTEARSWGFNPEPGLQSQLICCVT